MQLQLMTGARRGESISLLWANVDLEAQAAFLPKTKNGRSRKLPLRSDLVALLRQLPRTGEFELHVHNLRHEANSRVAEIGSNTYGGFSLLDLQAFSGHRDVRMLMCAQGLAKGLDTAFSSTDTHVIRHGRKRLKARAKITVKDIVEGATAVQPDCAPENHPQVQAPASIPPLAAAGVHPMPSMATEAATQATENVIRVDFKRHAA